jgi:hypothetical protein
MSKTHTPPHHRKTAENQRIKKKGISNEYRFD